MQRETSRSRLRERLTYANVMSTIAVFLAFGGATAIAAGQLSKNSVGSRQLKASSVTTGKVASNAINGSKVASHSLTGEDINLSQLGTVPLAIKANAADEASTVGGHGASCPANTTLINGICFDSKANPVAATLIEAADACNSKGGYLPTPIELYETRGVLNLGLGGGEHQYTDSYYYNTSGANPSTVTINGEGHISEQGVAAPSRYTCAYPLVR